MTPLMSASSPTVRRQRHGRWTDPQGSPTASHAEYCNVSGAHITERCGIRHHDADGESCPVIRLWCPERGASLWVGW